MYLCHQLAAKGFRCYLGRKSYINYLIKNLKGYNKIRKIKDFEEKLKYYRLFVSLSKINWIYRLRPKSLPSTLKVLEISMKEIRDV